MYTNVIGIDAASIEIRLKVKAVFDPVTLVNFNEAR